MEQSIPAESTAEKVVISSPKIITLCKEGWQFIKQRKDVAGWFLLASIIMAVLSSEVTSKSLEEVPTYELTLIVALLASVIFYMFNTCAVIYLVSQSTTSAVTYKQAIDWVGKNFFLLIWTGLVSSLAVLAGYILLIVPGILLSIYLYFSIYAQAMGSGAGTKALKQSYRDVKGKWWLTAWKLTILSFYMLLIYAVSLVVYGAIFIFAGENKLTTLLIDVLAQGVLGGILSVIAIYAMAGYYKYLRSIQS